MILYWQKILYYSSDAEDELKQDAYIGYQMSMVIMVQAVLFMKTVLKHKRKGVDGVIGDDLYRLGT